MLRRPFVRKEIHVSVDDESSRDSKVRATGFSYHRFVGQRRSERNSMIVLMSMSNVDKVIFIVATDKNIGFFASLDT